MKRNTTRLAAGLALSLPMLAGSGDINHPQEIPRELGERPPRIEQEIGALSLYAGGEFKMTSEHANSASLTTLKGATERLGEVSNGQLGYKIVDLGKINFPIKKYEGSHECLHDLSVVEKELRESLGKAAQGRILAVDLHGTKLCMTDGEVTTQESAYFSTDPHSGRLAAHELAHLREVAHNSVAYPVNEVDLSKGVKVDDLSRDLCSNDLMGVYCDESGKPLTGDESFRDDESPTSAYSLRQMNVITDAETAKISNDGEFVVKLSDERELIADLHRLAQVHIGPEVQNSGVTNLRIEDSSHLYVNLDARSSGAGVEVTLGGNAQPGPSQTATRVVARANDHSRLQLGESIKIENQNVEVTVRVVGMNLDSKQAKVVIERREQTEDRLE